MEEKDAGWGTTGGAPIEGEPKNPPAFPASGDVECENGHWTVKQSGMTLRDYFAAAALQGLLAGGKSVDGEPLLVGRVDETAWLVSHAYELADDMLKAR